MATVSLNDAAGRLWRSATPSPLSVSYREINALVGVYPYVHEIGKMKGQRTIWGAFGGFHRDVVTQQRE